MKGIMDFVFGLTSGPTIAAVVAAVGAIFWGIIKGKSADKAKAQRDAALREAEAQKGKADAILRHSQDNANTVAAGRGRLPDPAKDPNNRDNRSGPTT